MEIEATKLENDYVEVIIISKWTVMSNGDRAKRARELIDDTIFTD